MDFIKEKYINWDFDREVSLVGKNRRWIELMKYIIHLEKKLFCHFLSKHVKNQLERKRVILLFEFLDLSGHLGFDMEREMGRLSSIIAKRKIEYKICIDCYKLYKDCICEDERCETCVEKIDECVC